MGARGSSAGRSAKTSRNLDAHVHEPRARADRIVVVRRVGDINRVCLIAFHPIDRLLFEGLPEHSLKLFVPLCQALKRGQRLEIGGF